MTSLASRLVEPAVTLLFVGLLAVFVGRGSRLDADLLPSAFVPGTGAAASLPPEILDLAAALHGRPVTERYALHGRLRTDTLLMQRAHEYLYPVRFADDARTRLSLRADPAPPGCTMTAEHERIAEFRCP